MFICAQIDKYTNIKKLSKTMKYMSSKELTCKNSHRRSDPKGKPSSSTEISASVWLIHVRTAFRSGNSTRCVCSNGTRSAALALGPVAVD